MIQSRLKLRDIDSGYKRYPFCTIHNVEIHLHVLRNLQQIHEFRLISHVLESKEKVDDIIHLEMRVTKCLREVNG